jgi:hypothetical protein
MPITRLSAWVALACKRELFQRFLGVNDEAAAVDAVRTRCGVASRAEFDRDPEAKARLDRLIRFPFIDFTHDQEHHS